MTEKFFIFKVKKFRVGKFKMIYAGSTIFDFPTLDFLVWKIKQLEKKLILYPPYKFSAYPSWVYKL